MIEGKRYKKETEVRIKPDLVKKKDGPYLKKQRSWSKTLNK